MSDFLFEIGLEEIPARMIASAERELHDRIIAMLRRERLLVGEDYGTMSLSTPRRLAVDVWGNGLKDRQDDLSEELLGPAIKIAYKGGIPGPAAVAFAKKSGVAVSELKIVSTPKGDYASATSVRVGRRTDEVISSELPKELASIYWAKNMYWRPGKPERFVRPVRWITALLDDQVVPVSFAGYTADRVTYGHRVMYGGAPIALGTAFQYKSQLLHASVMADVEDRRYTIRKGLDRICRTIPETRWREDEELVDKLTHLTEWPSVIAGNFEAEFLTLPEEVLVTVMRDHQNYFAIEDAAGKLAPHFLAVLNTVATKQGESVIRHGNERVLRARFNDARFFWEFDQRVPLVDRVALLENVTFQKELGSYAAKSARVAHLCDLLASVIIPRGTSLDVAALQDAARLAKTDLTSELVKEFTELQGVVGGLYARAQGFSDATADAIYDHYRPVSMEAPIPRTVEGSLLAIADKADTIAGMFSLGLEPTGSKDPFALRRAANGIVRILAESDFPLLLSEVVAAAAKDPAVSARIAAFFAERLEFYLREARGQAYDVVKAVLAAGADDPRDAVARAEAVTAVRPSEDFAAVSAAFKRMKNILSQAQEKGIAPGSTVDSALLCDEAEIALENRADAMAALVERLSAEKNYKAALEASASLRPQVDSFFEAVMVMAPDAAVRGNRLALLTRITADFSRIADFSEIVVAG